MTADKSVQINQLKWIYSGFAGICVAYFLALLSSSVDINDSICLFLATVCFGIALPIYTVFVTAHVMLIEAKITEEKAKKVLDVSWVRILTLRAFYLFFSGFLFLIGHFSLALLGGVIVVTIICLGQLKRFWQEIKS